MFIRVLKSKLNDVLVPSQAKKKENLGIDTRLSFEKIRKVLRTSDGRLRTANGKHELKDISLLAVDFAGGNLPRRPKGSQPRMRPMTSKSNSNSINQRKNLAGQKTKPNLSPLKIGLNFTYVDDPRESSIENQDHILEHDTSREREEFRLLRSPRYQIE